MKASSEKLRIGEVAKKLNIERFVIRFWEREFGIKSHRSSGGQRFYDIKDMQLISLIKELLYDNGLTIAGAKKYLEQHRTVRSARKTLIAAKLDTEQTKDPHAAPITSPSEHPKHNAQIREHLLHIKERLEHLQKILSN